MQMAWLMIGTSSIKGGKYYGGMGFLKNELLENEGANEILKWYYHKRRNCDDDS